MSMDASLKYACKRLKQYGQRKSLWSSLRLKTPGDSWRTTNATTSVIEGTGGTKTNYVNQINSFIVNLLKMKGFLLC